MSTPPPNNKTFEDDDKLPPGFKDDIPIQVHPSLYFKIGSWLYNNGYVNNDYYAHRGDCMALYTFYYQTVRHQGNVNVWLTQRFTVNALGWTKKRVRETKEILLKMGLIGADFQREVPREEKTGRFQKCNLQVYTPVNFVWTPEKIEMNEVEESIKLTSGLEIEDIIKYKIYRDILLKRVKNGKEIITRDEIEFEDFKDGPDSISTQHFSFNYEDNLVALDEEDGWREYIIPTHKVSELYEKIVMDLV